jgi:hypothetical protein
VKESEKTEKNVEESKQNKKVKKKIFFEEVRKDELVLDDRM